MSTEPNKKGQMRARTMRSVFWATRERERRQGRREKRIWRVEKRMRRWIHITLRRLVAPQLCLYCTLRVSLYLGPTDDFILEYIVNTLWDLEGLG